MTREEAIGLVKSAFDAWEYNYDTGDDWSREHEALDMAIKALKQEPCDDAISRQAVLNNLEKPMNWTDSEAEVQEQRDYESFVSLIESMPPVIPQQKIGHWEICEDTDGIYGVCSECGQDADFSHYGKAYCYCPNCGAKMEVGE